MKNILIYTAAILLASCSTNKQAEAPAQKAAEMEPLKATRWTPKGELYLEYPALVANQKSRFAIHLTRLSDFKAVKDAACEVNLSVGAARQVFPCDPSAHPGIFGATVEPKSAGEAKLQISAHGKDLNETFDVGQVRIAPDQASAEKPVEAKEETINFTKEQQWALDFGTQIASQQTLRASLRVPAETSPRAGGEAAVIAPIAGRIVMERAFPAGTAVQKGAVLASIVPPTGSAADVPSLQLAEKEARIAVEQAQRDRARAERLVAGGAVPAKRAEEARAVEATAQARLQAARARMALHEATFSGADGAGGAKRFLVHAPISGIISESTAVSGANVELASVLFRIVNIDSLYLIGIVPEAEFSKLRQLSGAEVEMPDGGRPRGVSRLVSIGRLVDAETRTVPVTYEIDNRDHSLAVNQTFSMRLLLRPDAQTATIPEAAVIDDAGRPVVFVQVAGESFLRRPVKLGMRAGGEVQVLEGVNAGDRIVTKGAYLIRLATMSTAVPAHGHVH